MKTTLLSLICLLSIMSGFAQGPSMEWQNTISSSYPNGVIMKSAQGDYTLMPNSGNKITFTIYNSQGAE